MHFPNSWSLIIELHCAPYIRFYPKQIHLIRVKALYRCIFDHWLEPPVNMNKIWNSNIFLDLSNIQIFEYEIKNLNEYVAIPSPLIWWRISSFVSMFPVLAPILKSKIEIVKAYCHWTGIFCPNLANSQRILLQYGSFCREFPIFEYIRYSNMKLNEYGIFEYAKNGHSLGALPLTEGTKEFQT